MGKKISVISYANTCQEGKGRWTREAQGSIEGDWENVRVVNGSDQGRKVESRKSRKGKVGGRVSKID